jgi:transcription antitermination factor NusG
MIPDMMQEKLPEPRDQNDFPVALREEAQPSVGWHVLWTRSNCEQRVRDQLAAKQYEVYLPMMKQWATRTTKSPASLGPMFKGYLFVRHAIDKAAFLDISNIKGLVRILGESWNRLGRIPDEEVAAIRQMVDSHQPLFPYPYLKAGSPVRIVRGSLRDIQGVLVESDPERSLFVVSVHLLQRSLAVAVNCEDVVPA